MGSMKTLQEADNQALNRKRFAGLFKLRKLCRIISQTHCNIAQTILLGYLSIDWSVVAFVLGFCLLLII